MWLLAATATVLGFGWQGVVWADNPQPGAAAIAEEATLSRIDRLIEQLGAEDFGVRERAQVELTQAGLEAYDALHAAQSHHDPEIALRARYLVRSMNVRWFAETDSPKVVAILKDYGESQEAERRNLIDRLAALDGHIGLAALVRLARFETSDALAKYAALQVMQWPLPADAAVADMAKTIRSVAGTSSRASAAWLRLFARTTEGPGQVLADWDQATRTEHELFGKNPERTSREVVRDLFRFQVELLKSQSREDEAAAVMRRTVSLVDGSPEQVQEMADWLIHREAWPVALEMLEKNSEAVADRPQLLYRLASVHEKLGHQASADETAKRALALRPESLDEHILLGRQLEETRGLEKWAEAEYRLVLANATAGSQQDFKARFKLAEILHDRLEELPAAEMVNPIVDAFSGDKEEAVKETWSRATLLSPETLIARMHYFFACHAHEQQDFAKEREHLQAASNAFPQDADVLIAMYRLPNTDEAWQAKAKENIVAAVAEFRGEFEASKAAVDGADNEQSRDDALRVHAINCNQYAWLVGNTFGDYQEAVKLSQESVSICDRLPEMKSSRAGFLDTLGRCYFGAGDVANAVKHQRLAVGLNPISGQIRRQLQVFEKAAVERGVALP